MYAVCVFDIKIGNYFALKIALNLLEASTRTDISYNF